MKTKWITSNNNSRYCFIIAVMVAFICSGCSKEYEPQPTDEQAINDKIKTEFFHVHPGGTTVTAFDGNVLIDFPAETIPTTTKFSIVSFPVNHLDLHGINMMNRGFSIKNITNNNEFAIPVKIMVRYDQVNFNECTPSEESDLAIYRFHGDRYGFHKVEEIGECCVDCSCKTINVCINECGTYVVVEN